VCCWNSRYHTFYEQLLRRNVNRFRGGLVFKAHRLVYHSTLGVIVIKKKKYHFFLEMQKVQPDLDRTKGNRTALKHESRARAVWS